MPYGGDELFVGRTGYICGALWLEKVEGRKVVPDKDINELCMSIVESGRRNAQSHRRPSSPLMFSYYDTEYLGKQNIFMRWKQSVNTNENKFMCNLWRGKRVKAAKVTVRKYWQYWITLV